LPTNLNRASLLIAGLFNRVYRLAFTLASAQVRSEMKTLLLAVATVAALAGAHTTPATAQATKPVSQVVQWNRTLLVIVRTPGAAGNHPPYPQLCHHARRNL
jgi:hypothetical protein